jgi:pimeloyl-ACP methyl ester carboxylesterase
VESKINNLSTTEDFSLEYAKFGAGKSVLLAFHGFGRHFSDFEILVPSMGKLFTIYAINIFHHGNSAYPQNRIEKNTLKKEELAELFNQFFKANQIDRFSLIGYSLGGKVALTIAEYFAARLDHLILVAPDGIYINKWYKFAAINPLGRRLARWTMNHPKPFFKFADFLKWSKIVPPHLHRFAYIHFDTLEKRQLVYKVWMTFRRIDPDIAKIQELLNEHEVNTILVFGKFDRVIPPQIGERFVSKLKQENALHIMEAGHILLKEDLGILLEKLLRSQNE